VCLSVMQMPAGAGDYLAISADVFVTITDRGGSSG